MVKTELTDEALRNAAGLVRGSMLSSLKRKYQLTNFLRIFGNLSWKKYGGMNKNVRESGWFFAGVSPPCSPPWWVSPFSSA